MMPQGDRQPHQSPVSRHIPFIDAYWPAVKIYLLVQREGEISLCAGRAWNATPTPLSSPYTLPAAEAGQERAPGAVFRSERADHPMARPGGQGRL